MLYDGWSNKLAQRFQKRFDALNARHNFDYGDEFEIAVCEVLRTILPERASVCRGYVVGQNGQVEGDDIIIFDSAQFTTLRGLGADLSLKEEVPAEAVLAYIEAKHTLDVNPKSRGQSVKKACTQAAKVKTIEREAAAFGDHLGFGLARAFSPIRGPQGYPDRHNPWYTAVWARNLRLGSKKESERHCLMRAVAVELFEHDVFPDVIAAGSTIMLPGVADRDEAGRRQGVRVQRFLHGEAELSACSVAAPLGVAALHLLHVIEWIRLGKLPLGKMLCEQIDPKETSHAEPPLRLRSS